MKISSLGHTAVTISVTLVLVLLGASCYLFVGARAASDSIISGVGVSLLLDDDIKSEERAKIETNLKAEPMVKQWNYLSKEDAATDFEKNVGVEFRQTLESNPIPASYEVSLGGESISAEVSSQLAARAQKWDGVVQVVYGKQVMERVASTLSGLNMLLMCLGALLLFVAVVLIYNTINLSVAASRAAISTMQLVGATRGFIRHPYLVRGVIQGAVAGVAASAILYGALRLLQGLLPMVSFSVPISTILIISCLQIAVGIIICFIFTTVSVNKYIK